MQKINCRRLKNQNGSILVGVIALAIIMAVVSIAYLQISTSSARNIIASQRDKEAFWAVESGALLGAAFAITLNESSFSSQDSSPVGDFVINKYKVNVRLKSLTGGKLKIYSTTSPVNDSYFKRITLEVNSTYGQFAFLYNRSSPVEQNGSHSGNGWLGWGVTNSFIGRFHMNDRIRLNGDYWNTGFNFSGGRVTVSHGAYDSYIDANHPSYSHMNYTTGHENGPNVGGFNNNFDDGVEVKGLGADNWTPYTAGQNMPNGKSVHANLNGWFKDGFLANQPQIDMPTGVMQTVLSGAESNVVNLPVSSVPKGQVMGNDATNYRPTIEFNNSGEAIYHYYDGTSFQDVSYTSGKVLHSSTDVNVLGVVSGRWTVVSDAGKDIVIVDDGNNASRGNDLPGLVYHDYSATASGASIPTSNKSDVLALVTGNNIDFCASWKKTWNSTTTTSIDIVEGGPDINGNKYIHLNAVLIATANANSCVNFINGGPRIYVTGSNIINTYKSHAKQGNTYQWDKRLMQNVSFPNQPMVKNANGLLVLTISNWQELNQKL